MLNFQGKKPISNVKYTYIGIGDGFGAQYQQLITAYVVCNIHNERFVYTPREKMEHNYDNDPDFLKQIEDLMNIKNNIENNTNNSAKILDYAQLRQWFEGNIDNACNSEYFKQIRSYFWQNKERNIFKNDKINVAVHIRRKNQHDVLLGHNDSVGGRATSDSYYLNIMKIIREKYKDKNLLFHIYSQGNTENFKKYKSGDVKFHINEDICKTFIGLVSADILVTSASSFSYTAALLSDGKIYYKKFWHNPRKHWIIC
tara:strand:+ start:1970 stop:2740 length:771 start_codon:yes stop_codon:yes gene_type:complete